MRIFNAIIRFFSSIGLSCVLLLLLGLLTWLGTLEQVDHGLYDVQKKYFESFFLVHDSGRFPLPLPGANLVLCLLGVNLLLGGMVRLRKTWRTAGILVVHVGMALLLFSGVVKMYFSDDGHVTLFEGQSAQHFESYYRFEVVIDELVGDGKLSEYVIPQEEFLAAADGTVTLKAEGLPFALELKHWMRNCRPMPKGPMFEVDVPVVDGVFLKELPKEKTAEKNIAGVYATAIGGGERREGVLYALQRAPWTFEVDGRRFAVDLRHERYPMPFVVRLDKFTKKDHARTSMAAHYSSDVTITEGKTSRPVHIKMNEPLRDEGLVLYQASWGEGFNGELFSTLAVVRNPADQYPLYACIVIGLGMLGHFLYKLIMYILKEFKAV